jgi:polysaccharide biosynthesis protein PslH
MALKTPVVSTAKGAEGLHFRHGKELLLADTAEEFADAVLTLLGDPKARRRLAEGAFESVRAQYSWKSLLPRFLQLVGQLGSHCPDETVCRQG